MTDTARSPWSLLWAFIPVPPEEGRINRRNTIFRNGSRVRVGKAAGYASFVTQVAYHCQRARAQQGVATIRTGALDVWITLFVGSIRRRRLPGVAVPILDVDAPIKGVLDGMARGGVFDDDARVVSLSVKKCFPIPPQAPGIQVEVRTAPWSQDHRGRGTVAP